MEAAFETITSPPGLAVVGATVALIYIVYRFLVTPFRVLSRLGIRGPTPLPILGNYLSIQKNGYMAFLEAQKKRFGSVYGYYVGSNPVIAITDQELLKEIMVKDTEAFQDRGNFGLIELVPKALDLNVGLVGATGETWKTGRHTLSPSFSAMKMKLMVPLIKKSSDTLVEKLEEAAELGKSVEMFSVFGLFTMETLIATAFGQYVDVQRGGADQLTKAADIIFRSNAEGSAIPPELLFTLLSNFPWLEPLVLILIRNSKVAHSALVLQSSAVGLINERIQSKEPPKVKDLLQLMIDSTVDGGDGDGKGPRKLTSKQIAAFSIDFLLAGYETTANLLSFTSYLLAMNTDIQEKLQAEIDNQFEEDPDSPLYEAAQKSKYLDMVLQETLRLYTPIPRTQRHCSKTVTINNVTIPEGADIVIPMHIIHHMPEYWPDPCKFDPERFTAEAKASRPQLAHMPFGWGPRNCIGLRFALLEAKIALMEILKKFSFARSPETPNNLEIVYGLTSVAKGGIALKIIPRN